MNFRSWGADLHPPWMTYSRPPMQRIQMDLTCGGETSLRIPLPFSSIIEFLYVSFFPILYSSSKCSITGDDYVSQYLSALRLQSATRHPCPVATIGSQICHSSLCHGKCTGSSGSCNIIIPCPCAHCSCSSGGKHCSPEHDGALASIIA